VQKIHRSVNTVASVHSNASCADVLLLVRDVVAERQASKAESDPQRNTDQQEHDRPDHGVHGSEHRRPFKDHDIMSIRIVEAAECLSDLPPLGLEQTSLFDVPCIVVALR